ncbi:glycosyltransferase family 2 protein [Galactobacter caseinivorans]|uniref:Glycosyltransferase family 2 protein n=1 Tax=Galactobacter caseinivorans TaxID=2676123 RepID=A0A496PIQ3_9MICC|nr:glycosyltransferase family 2 protein [Galactobacter caseinivorans]RKW70359.1 glycosyltransferase family 2 protein [Galactobacter caseinivorans]
MSSGPLISIVLPAKDQAPFIDDALVSLRQQFQDPTALQVIVVDDGSSDGTGELAAAHARFLPHLSVLRNETPTGLASARNQGLAHATADVLGFMDGDDWLARGHLQQCLSELRRLDVDFVRTDHVQVKGGHRVLVRAPQARRSVVLDPRESILPEHTSTMVDYPFAWAGLFQRRLVDRGLLEFPPGLFTAEDRPWIWRLFLQATSYAMIEAPGIMYRRGVSTSLTQIYDERQLDFARSYLMAFEVLEADPEAGRFWPKMARQFLAVAAHHRTRREGMDATVKERQTALIRSVLERIPRAVLAAEFKRLDHRRRALLGPVLPNGVRKGKVAA